jgi:hypothetical protein
VTRRLTALGAIALGSLVCAGFGVMQASDALAAARRTTTATLWELVQQRCASEATERLPPYPWPIAPVNQQHPVRGYFGDPRTVTTGIGEGAFSFHNGVDISAFAGNHVFPVASGVVTEVLPDRVVVASAYDRRFQYIHIHPWVRVGARVVASRTVLGIVDPVFHHVHLSEIRGVCVVNPLMPGHLTPYRDTTHPVVREILFENAAGVRLSPSRLTGRVRVVADAYARPAMASPFPWASMPVSPVLIRWKLITMAGRVLDSQVAADFRYSLPPRRAFCEVYAPGTEQNFAAVVGTFRWGKPGRYLYDLTPNLLDTARLHDGRYRFVVTAANTGGNVGVKSMIIGVDQRPVHSELVPRLDARCKTRLDEGER